MKEDLQKQISEHYKNICALTSSDNPSTLEYSVKQMLGLIAKLAEGEDKFEYEEYYRRLFHTLRKEVQYALSAYKKTLGKNAAKVRKTEYQQQLDEVCMQIRVDIGSLLHK